MRLYLILIVFFFSSCGIIAEINRNKFIESKGYDPKKDTAIIKPYEYYIHHKGYIPIYQELKPKEKLNLIVNIQGFENSDTMSIERIFEPMKFVVNDSPGTITYGELHFLRASGVSYTLRFGKQFPDSCLCKSSFNPVKNKFRKLKKEDVLFFWNVNFLKDSIVYTLPSRVYYLK